MRVRRLRQQLRPQDQTRAAVPSEVVPRPVHEHRYPVAYAEKVDEVEAEPRQPRHGPGQLDAGREARPPRRGARWWPSSPCRGTGSRTGLGVRSCAGSARRRGARTGSLPARAGEAVPPSRRRYRPRHRPRRRWDGRPATDRVRPSPGRRGPAARRASPRGSGPNTGRPHQTTGANDLPVSSSIWSAATRFTARPVRTSTPRARACAGRSAASAR